MGARPARYAVEMARVLAGDEATLRARPPLSALICTIAPARPGRRRHGGSAGPRRGRHPGRLHVDGHGRLHGAGHRSPARSRQGDAEIVAALVLLQLVHPGAPVFHSLMPGVMEPRTGGYLATRLARRDRLRGRRRAGPRLGRSDARRRLRDRRPEPGGWQVAAESAVALTLCAPAGRRDRERDGPARVRARCWSTSSSSSTPTSTSGSGGPRRLRHESRGDGPRRHPRGRAARALPVPAPHARRAAGHALLVR